MILPFYNFNTDPFVKDIDTNKIFHSNSAKELLQRFEYIKQHRGIMLITGQPGVGKTLMTRVFFDSLNNNLFESVYIPLATVSRIDFYKQLAAAFTTERLWKKSQLFNAIQKNITSLVSNNKKIPVIVFDEAHMFKNENFQELQIISNFNMDSTDPAIFILLGQPHIVDRLLTPIHQSFNQRISLKFHFKPLSKQESMNYITHQLNIAGVKDPLFNDNALHAIHQNSNGIPRIINSIAKETLTIGAIEKKNLLSEEDVYRASKEI